MNLKEVYPLERITEKFDSPVSVEYYGIDDVNRIAELEPNCLFELGANAWMHYVESGAKVNPKKLAKFFDANDPLIFKRVEKEMKRKVVQDILLIHASVEDDALERKICGQLLLARVFPNNLHISDVEFSNPYKPVSSEEQKYHFHDYRSLGLFATLLANIVALGKANKISKVTLSAASIDQVPYFKKHGFKVEDTEFAKGAIANEMSIPMELKCT